MTLCNFEGDVSQKCSCLYYSHGEKLFKGQSGEVEVWRGCGREEYP